MARCQYPGCNTVATSCFCGDHNYEIDAMQSRIVGWLDGRTLPRDDAVFIVVHPKGCNSLELSQHLRLGKTTVSIYLRKAQLQGNKLTGADFGFVRGKSLSVWSIPAREIARACDLVRNWITAHQAAAIIRVNPDKLAKYALEGVFGPTTTAFNGGVAILRSKLPVLKANFECHKSRVIASRGKREYCRVGSEFTPYEVVCALEMAGVPTAYKTLLGWIGKGLTSRKDHGGYLIDDKAFQQFVAKGAHGEIPLIKRHIERCQSINEALRSMKLVFEQAE